MVIKLSYCLLYEENKLKHSTLPKCGIATPKDQYRVFNKHDSVKNRCFHEKNHQIENFIVESS